MTKDQTVTERCGTNWPLDPQGEISAAPAPDDRLTPEAREALYGAACKPTDEAPPEYNDGYTHEVLHTVYVIQTIWDEHISDTHCIDQFPDVKAAAEKIDQALHDFYQLVGSKS